MKKSQPKKYWTYETRYIDHAPELLEAQARGRRLDLFKSLTGLKEVRRRSSFLARVPRDYRDHTSFWTDGPSDYVLCEPYDPRLPLNPIPGLTAIVIPVEIAPYGGGWSDDPVAEAGTRGLLFGLLRDEARLRQLEQALRAQAPLLPKWNELASDKASRPASVRLEVPALLEIDSRDSLPDPESEVRGGS